MYKVQSIMLIIRVECILSEWNAYYKSIMYKVQSRMPIIRVECILSEWNVHYHSRMRCAHCRSRMPIIRVECILSEWNVRGQRGICTVRVYCPPLKFHVLLCVRLPATG